MCGCRKRGVTQQFTWTSDDGTLSRTYDSEIQAKAKVLRAGGAYAPAPTSQPATT